VVVADLGKVLALQEDRAAAALPTAAAPAVLPTNQVVNHKAVQDLVIVAAIVSTAPLELTSGVVEVVALALKVPMHRDFLDHHKALQVEPDEQIASTAQTGTGQVAAGVAHGAEAEAAMAVKVVVAVALEAQEVQAHPESTPVAMDKINHLKLQVPQGDQAVLTRAVVAVAQIKPHRWVATAVQELLLCVIGNYK
jgi:hypothetical protein